MSIGLHDVQRLSETVGPRPPGSAPERRAAHFVADRLDELSIPHTTLHFRTTRGPSTLYILPFIGLILGILVAFLSPVIGLLLSAASAVLVALEATTRPTVSRLLQLDSSQNVVALIPHRPHGEHSAEEPKRRVIVTAPIDSPRRGWLDEPPLAGLSLPLTILMLVAIAAIPILLAVALFVEGNVPVLVALVPGLIVVAGLIALIQRDFAGAEDPGHDSNASGVATALALAEELKRYPPLAVETLFVFTGASNAGSAGMISFLSENFFTPEKTYFLNLESVGRDPICFTRKEGPILALQSSPLLVQAAGDLALSYPNRHMRPIEHRGVPTEQYAALIRGYQGITIMSHPQEGIVKEPTEPGGYNDVDADAIEGAYLLAHGLVRRLDEDAALDQAPPISEQTANPPFPERT